MKTNPKESIVAIKKRIANKKTQLNDNPSPNDPEEVFLYPSSDLSLQPIDQSAFTCIHQIAINKRRSDLSFDDIQKIHCSFCKHPKAGKVREEEDEHVYIKRPNSKVVLVPTPLELTYFKLVDEFIRWLVTTQDNTIEIVTLAHIKFTALHPFVDGNGRVAHLLMNLLLLQDGYPIISFTSPNKYFNALEPISKIRYLDLLQQINEITTAMADFNLLVHKMIEKSLDTTSK